MKKAKHSLSMLQAGRRRGNVMVLVIVTTMMLFIIGIAFISRNRAERLTVANVEAGVLLEAGVNVVVGQINKVLVEDLLGTNAAAGMLDGSSVNEYWDYPGEKDKWLASLEPDYVELPSGDMVYYWRHITDLWGNDFAMPDDYSQTWYDPCDPAITDQWDSSTNDPCLPWVDEWLYRVTNTDYTGQANFKPTVVKIIPETGRTWTLNDHNFDYSGGAEDVDPCCPWGARADADGDGVADSRWVPIPNLYGPVGQQVYAAVRVIDNCAMINVNTAFRDPTNLATVPGEWDGSQLSHVNLEGIKARGDDDADIDVTALQQERYGTVWYMGDPAPCDVVDDYGNDQQYEREVARRILNPLSFVNNEHYEPFGIMDELELRNRFFISSPVQFRLGYTKDGTDYNWRVTFDPGANGVGQLIPYTDAGDVKNWYYKIKPDIDEPEWPTHTDSAVGFYNRRFLTTTYSFDRVIVPKTTATPAGELGAAWQDYLEEDPNGAGQDGAPVCINDLLEDGVTQQEMSLLAAAIWLGLPPDGTVENLRQFNGLGLSKQRERLACQMAVNLVDWVDSDPCDPCTTHFVCNGVDYYGFETYAERLYISTVALAQPLDANLPSHYAIELYNPGPCDVLLDNWTLDIDGVLSGLPLGQAVAGGTSFVIADSEDADPCISFALALVDWVDGTLNFLRGQTINLSRDRHTDKLDIPPGLLPANSGNKPLEIYRLDPFEAVLTGTQVLFPVRYEEDPCWPASPVGFSEKFETRATPIEVSMETHARNAALRTIGEMAGALAMGRMEVSGKLYDLPRYLERIYDKAALTEVTAGRLDVADEDYARIFQYVTLFDPFSDQVDNDGNGKSDDPTRDGVDNDGDGLVDACDVVDPFETFEKYGEYSELAVAGRININTAPWYVIAQLPWVADPALPRPPKDPWSTSADEVDWTKLARAIVAYRDKRVLFDSLGDPALDYTNRQTGMGGTTAVREELGFASIAELLNVTHDLQFAGGVSYDPYYDIRRYGRDGLGSPLADFTADDAVDDLEERDLIFHRVSNLVTVRSDVFTAYIVVRVGQRGPQRRVIGIFDRSGVFKAGDKPKLVALHRVPDPR